VGHGCSAPIDVAAGGRRLGPRDLGGPKAKQVLELLLVARGHNVTKDRLADQLWGEALPVRQRIGAGVRPPARLAVNAINAHRHREVP
jgi:hypothetical protein